MEDLTMKPVDLGLTYLFRFIISRLRFLLFTDHDNHFVSDGLWVVISHEVLILFAKFLQLFLLLGLLGLLLLRIQVVWVDQGHALLSTLRVTGQTEVCGHVVND